MLISSEAHKRVKQKPEDNLTSKQQATHIFSADQVLASDEKCRRTMSSSEISTGSRSVQHSVMTFLQSTSIVQHNEIIVLFLL